MDERSEHRHCRICGKVCDVGSETCGRTCDRELRRRRETRRNYAYLMYAFIALVVAVFLLSQLHL